MKNQERISVTGENDIIPINATNVRPFPYNRENSKNVSAKIINNTQNEYNLEREETAMDENKILEKYMDKVDQDRRDQEQRLSKNMELMEKRINDERKDSEERMQNRYDDLVRLIEKTNDKFDKTVDDIHGDFKDLSKEVRDYNNSAKITRITTLIGVIAIGATSLGIAIAIIIAIFQLIPKV